MSEVVTAPPALVGRVLRLVPKPLLRFLDGWSYRIALRRRDARRHAGERKVGPLPPVVTGRACPPHPWYV